ncbi:hypothetical protein D7X33_21775 [Butyricicoccus sp. 1XD8-22]|nr:hypothetical protein D7X33_21775 [Butyricicoccus sp. 1XD8-22]
MKLKVKVVRKVFYNNGWGIFACEVNEKDKEFITYNSYGNFTIKGNTVELMEGEWYEVELGDLEKSPKGDSYPIIKVVMPKNTSYTAQYLFLENMLTQTQFAELLAHYPKSKKYKIVDMIKSGEADLTQIRGIGKATSDRIIQRIVENEEKMQVINKLSPLGVSSRMIDKIIDHFETPYKVILKINESFYNLCEVKGLGFTTVDKYALANGEDKEGFKRIEACVNYLIHEQAKEGHSWTDIEEMVEMSVKLLDIDKLHVQSYLYTLDMTPESFIKSINEHQITTKYYYEQEKGVFEHLLRINENYKLEHSVNKLEQYIKQAEDYLNITYTDEQREVILESFKHGVYVINGKAGSGKSTIIKAITSICNNLGWKYQALALSGRAAQLLVNKNINASTIHRGLGYRGNGFAFDEDNPLDDKVIILEEASMVNAQLWNSVTQAVANGSKLIIVGDSGQLSGIGNGDVLRDLLDTGYFKGRELQQIHRQAQDSGIIEIANKIREGENVTGYNWTLSESHGVNSDLFLFTYTDKEKLAENAKAVIKNQMMKLDQDSIMDFQILVSNKSKGELSASSINKYCQSLYNDLSKKPVGNGRYDFRVSDKVIISGNRYDVHMYRTINDYHLDNPIMNNGEPEEYSLYNGTMGVVVDLVTTKGEESVLVEFEGLDGYIKLDKEQLGDLDLAYAITIHKSQGIGVKNVLFLLDFGAFKLLSKQLVYTAITRASEKCVVLAENNALLRAISQDASSIRKTFIKQLIEEYNK